MTTTMMKMMMMTKTTKKTREEFVAGDLTFRWCAEETQIGVRRPYVFRRAHGQAGCDVALAGFAYVAATV